MNIPTTTDPNPLHYERICALFAAFELAQDLAYQVSTPDPDFALILRGREILNDALESTFEGLEEQ